MFLAAAHFQRFQPEFPQSVFYGVRCPSRTEYEGFLVMFLQKRFYRPCETNHIAVEALHVYFVALVSNSHHIDRTYCARLFAHLVEVVHDSLLVGYRDIQPSQFRV